jgi:hypothetical protein
LGSNVEVLAQLDGGTSWSRVEPATAEIDKATGDVSVGWAKATAGRVMITRLQGSGGSGGGGTSDHSQLTNLDYMNSGHTGFESEDHGVEHRHGGNDEIATSTAAAYAIPKADGTGRLASAWIPDLSSTYEAVSRKNQPSGYAGLDSASKINRVQLPLMTGDQGSGGQTGSVPAPAAGDAGKCLKGSGTWGDCGTGGGGGIPGGTSGQLQYNSSGSFGGVTGTSISGSTINHTGKIDVGGGTFELPNGSGLPGSCVAGELYMNTNGSSGKRLYGCEGGTWVLQGDGVGTGGCSGGAPTDAEYVVGAADSSLTNEYVAQAGSGILITKASPNMRWEADCTYVGCQGDDNNFSGNNQVGVGTKYMDFSIPNDSGTGTTLNKLVSWNGDPVKAIRAPASTNQVLGVCVSGCGTSGSPRIALRGRALCVFDGGAPTAGNWAAVSTTTSGNCRDAGTSKPSSGLVGVVYSSVSQGGAHEVILMF